MSYDHESIKQYIMNNLDLVAQDGVIAGRIVEKLVAVNNNWKNVGCNNKSYDHIDHNGNKIETKSTGSIQQNRYLRIGGLSNKNKSCDIIQIIDLFRNKEFRVPHDTFFKYATLKYNQFWWSCDYKLNELRGSIYNNTKLLLEYEV